MATFLGVLAFSILILFAIFFHELGHFVTARWSGIKVSKFFVGFGPTLWSVRRGREETVDVEEAGIVRTVTRPETEYGVKAFPVGGFVKIVGMSPYEEVPAEDEPRSFDAVPRWKRAIVLAAGSVTHYITAFVVLFLIFGVIGFENFDRPTLTIGSVITEIDGKPSPAVRAGLEPGDTIVAVNGEPVESYDEVGPAIRSREGRPVTLEVVKDGGDREVLTIRPAIDDSSGEPVPVVGIYPQGEVRRQNPIEAIGSSGKAIGNLTTAFFRHVPQAFTPQTLGLSGEGPTDDRPFSIVGAGRIAGELAARGRIVDFLALFVQINIFVAIFNMVPLPPLDGGHLLVLGIEKLRGKPVHPRALVPVMAVVLSLLLLLAVLLLYYDIVEPPQLPVR